MADKIIKLSRSYEAHGKVFDTITLREPKWRDYVAIGEVYERQTVGEASAVVIHYDRLGLYGDRLATSVDPGALADLDIVDAFQVSEAIIGFFTTARRSLVPQMPSSGVPEKTSERSSG